MKKLIISLVSCYFLVGCTTGADINANNYLTANKVKPNQELVGTWTGGVGPYIYTIKINNDGNGYFCYSWNKIDSAGKMVYDGSDLITQNGEKLKVNGIDNGQLNLSASYYMVTDKYKFYKDDATEKASTYCQSFYEKLSDNK